MSRSLALIPVSVLSAVVLAACGSGQNKAVPSLGGATHTRRSASSGGLAGGRSGTVLHVGRWPGVHHTYPTIQAAVKAARPGDRVLIAAGDYHESPDSGVGVWVTTPDIVIEGVDRNKVIVATPMNARPPYPTPDASELASTQTPRRGAQNDSALQKGR